MKRVTDDDLERAEQAVNNLTAEQRRRRDVWGRRFERACLFVLVILYWQGFHAEHDNRAAIKINRVKSTREVCTALNRNATAANRNTAFIAGLVVAGAKQSKPFDALYRQFHLPSYEQRLAQAERTADELRALTVPVLDCRQLIRQARDAR